MPSTSLHIAIGAAALVALSACGSTSSLPTGRTAGASTKPLAGAGWKVHSARGGTVSKVKQTGFLELIAPDGSAIDLQFIDTASAANAEFDAAIKSIPNFHGVVFENVIIFLAPLGATAVPAVDVTALRGLVH